MMPLVASLQAADLPWAELSGVQANPRSGKVYEGIELCRREGCDFLLALGGGSVIDTAKAHRLRRTLRRRFLGLLYGKSLLLHHTSGGRRADHLRRRQ